MTNHCFTNWFGQSKAVDQAGQPQVFYHGSISDFTVFETSKIRADETDAVYNGFWFTSDKEHASPAWRDPKYVKAFYLSIQNPASHSTVKELYREIRNNESLEADYPTDMGFRSVADIIRYELQKRGYDGVIHQEVPEIDVLEFESKGETVYTTNRGFNYKLKRDDEFGGVDLFKVREDYEDHITGYEDLNDFIEQHSERVFVVFNPNQIKSIDNVGTWNVLSQDIRY